MESGGGDGGPGHWGVRDWLPANHMPLSSLVAEAGLRGGGEVPRPGWVSLPRRPHARFAHGECAGPVLVCVSGLVPGPLGIISPRETEAREKEDFFVPPHVLSA